MMDHVVELPTAADVQAARANIAGIAHRSPLWRLDADVPATRIWLKLENLQPLGSFKIRAAVNALKTADPEAMRQGVLAPSAGNFGQGVAWAAAKMGAPVTIVAPDTSAMTKTAALERLGARVIRVPFGTWWSVLTTRRFEGEGGVFFHPVADSAVVAGNATIGAEILEDLPDLSAVVVPYGGGGLISGIGSIIRRLKPGVRMIAVEAETALPMAAALASGAPTPVPYAPSFVDGIGSTTVLAEMWPLVRATTDQAVAVSLAEIAGAVRLLATRHHVIAEGAGAAAVAPAVAGGAGPGGGGVHHFRRQHRRLEAGLDPQRRTSAMIDPDALPRIVFGCGNFGGLGSSPDTRGRGDDRDRARALLDHARDLGLTRFDTANTYGGGASEAILGEWLHDQGKNYRARIQVATKVGNPHGCPPGERPLSRAQVAEHLDRSLQRLGLEQIDLYYLHEFDPSTPLEKTFEALDRGLASGKIAAFGVSNATVDDLQAVLALTGDSDLRGAFTHVQNQFNLLEQGDLDAVIPLAQAQGLAYVAFSPLAGGLLTGKYRQGQTASAGTRLDLMPSYYQDLLTPSTFEAIEALRRRAASHGWSLPEAALHFILDTPGVESLIIAPRSIEQFDGHNLAAPPSHGGVRP